MVSTDKRAANGTFLPGNPGGGRPKLPDWLKAHTEALLRLQVQAALEGSLTYPATPDEPERIERVPVKERLLACDRLLDRLLGKPPAAPEDVAARASLLTELIRLDRERPGED